MAVPPIVIKLAVTAATDKRTWKAVAALIAAVFVPIIVAVMMIGALFSIVETANNNLLDYSFSDVSVPEEFTEEQQETIENMRDWLEQLDEVIAEKIADNEEFSLDENMVRAAFYCLNFGENLDEDYDFELFCECFENADYEDLETILQSVAEEFEQYEINENLVCSVEKVYGYLDVKEDKQMLYTP